MIDPRNDPDDFNELYWDHVHAERIERQRRDRPLEMPADEVEEEFWRSWDQGKEAA